MEPKPVLLKQLQEQDSARHAAAEALMLMGDAALSAFIDGLVDPDWMVRGVAAEALGEMGSTSAIDHLVAALGDPQAEVRRAAAWALAQVGKQAMSAARVVGALFAVLESGDPLVREAAITALGSIKHADVPNALLWALGDPEAPVREVAADAVGRLGKETIQVLIDALDNEYPAIRAAVATAVAKIAKQYSKADAATPALIKRLSDYDADVRRIAAEALGQIEDPDATEALCERLWDEVPEVRKMVAWALGQIEDPDALPSLLQALGDPVPDVQEAVIEALGKLVELDAVPYLMQMLGHNSQSVRRASARALGQIGGKHPDSSQDILAGLLHALGDPDAVVRRMAARSMGEIGEKVGDKNLSADIASGLLHALVDTDLEVRKNAAAALGLIGHHEAVGGLFTLFRTEGKVRA